MPVMVITDRMITVCRVCGKVFEHTTIREITEPMTERVLECPDCSAWAGVELLSYRLMHNLEARRA